MEELTRTQNKQAGRHYATAGHTATQLGSFVVLSLLITTAEPNHVSFADKY